MPTSVRPEAAWRSIGRHHPRYPFIDLDQAQERIGGGPGIFLHDSSMIPNIKFRDFAAVSLLGLVIAWRLFGEIFSPLFWFAMSVLYAGVRYG